PFSALPPRPRYRRSECPAAQSRGAHAPQSRGPPPPLVQDRLQETQPTAAPGAYHAWLGVGVLGPAQRDALLPRLEDEARVLARLELVAHGAGRDLRLREAQDRRKDERPFPSRSLVPPALRHLPREPSWRPEPPGPRSWPQDGPAGRARGPSMNPRTRRAAGACSRMRSRTTSASYYDDRGRRQLASAPVKAPPMGQWHLLRVVAIGDHIQGWLDGALLLDHRDARFRTGRAGP